LPPINEKGIKKEEVSRRRTKTWKKSIEIYDYVFNNLSPINEKGIKKKALYEHVYFIVFILKNSIKIHDHFFNNLPPINEKGIKKRQRHAISVAEEVQRHGRNQLSFKTMSSIICHQYMRK
jgi:hypothetical protein